MKRYNHVWIILLTLVLFLCCSSTRNVGANTSQESQLNELKEVLATKSFKFIAETAHPMQTYAVTQVTNALLRNTGNTAGTIFLTGSGDYIKIVGDTVTAEMSYFGELRIVSSIDQRDNGINFNGEPLNFVITKHKKRKALNLEFDVSTKTEMFNIVMQIYPSKRANIVVNSSNRTSIRYVGEIVVLDEKEKTSL